MKDVKKCSLSGIAFTMDTDAYDTLDRYIDSLRQQCGTTPDGNEIVADIEARIAELILSAHDRDAVVEKPLIDNIIKQMGSPEDIATDETEPAIADSRNACNEPRIPRRLYRDMEQAKLGGVCSGLARYFDTDPVWVRLLFLVPLLLMPVSGMLHLSGSLFGNMFAMVVLSYIIMWFAVPPARSARQKLEMNGEKITARSIRDTTMAESADIDRNVKPVMANVVTVFGQIVLILLKILAGIIVFTLIIAACALIIGILVISIRGYGNIFHVHQSALVAALGLAVVLVPVILLIYVLMCMIASRKPGAKTVLAIFMLWLMTIVFCAVTAAYEYRHRNRFPLPHNWSLDRSHTVVDGDTVTAERIISHRSDNGEMSVRFGENGKFVVEVSDGESKGQASIDFSEKGIVSIHANDDSGERAVLSIGKDGLEISKQ